MSLSGGESARCSRCGRRGTRAADDVEPEDAEVGLPIISDSKYGGATCDPCEAARTEEAEYRAGWPASPAGRGRRRRRGRDRVRGF